MILKMKHSNHQAFAAIKTLLPVLVLCFIQSFGQDTLVANNMLMFQRSVGGWSKHYGEKAVDYKRIYTPDEKAAIIDEASRNDATIDNGATSKEIRYLLKAYKLTNNKIYLSAAENGIRYLLKAQYPNGGWPQFFPDTSSYRNEITYNDNAMVNALNILYDIVLRENDMEVVDAAFVSPSADAVERGVQCILKTQVIIKGKRTAWCAQYNCRTLQPAKARAYELPSLSGMESVGIVDFLMKQPHPSELVKQAVNSAVEWFEASKIPGYKYIDVPDSTLPKKRDRVLLPDSSGVVWARFYDIETNQPFFSGRDGVKKKAVTEIEYERRVGYQWYGTWPKDLLEKTYPKWKANNS